MPIRHRATFILNLWYFLVKTYHVSYSLDSYPNGPFLSQVSFCHPHKLFAWQTLHFASSHLCQLSSSPALIFASSQPGKLSTLTLPAVNFASFQHPKQITTRMHFCCCWKSNKIIFIYVKSSFCSHLFCFIFFSKFLRSLVISASAIYHFLQVWSQVLNFTSSKPHCHVSP